MLIPGGGTFIVNKVRLEGSCNGQVIVQVDGNIKAPDNDNEGDTWFTFHDINGFAIKGSGIFDGNGKAAWGKGSHLTKVILSYNNKISSIICFVN